MSLRSAFANDLAVRPGDGRGGFAIAFSFRSKEITISQTLSIL